MPHCYEAGIRHSTHYSSVLRIAVELYLQGGEFFQCGLTMFDLERNNIHLGQLWSENNCGSDDKAARISLEYAKAGKYLLSLRLHPRERLRWLEASLFAARRLRQRLDEGVVLGRIGLAYFDMGDWNKAIVFHRQHLAIGQEINDKRSEGVALGNLAIAYLKIGEVETSIDLIQKSLTIARERGDLRDESIAIGNLGLAYLNLKDYEKAIFFFEQRLLTARALGDRMAEGRALNHIGIAYRKSGTPEKAIPFYEQQLFIAREINDTLSEATALFDKSFCLADAGKRTEAIECAETALQLYTCLESPYVNDVIKQLSEWKA